MEYFLITNFFFVIRANEDDPEHSLSSAISTESITTQYRKPRSSSHSKSNHPIIVHKQPIKNIFKSSKSENQQSGKRRCNSSSSILSGKTSRESIEMSETECDRAIVPPPRSYSDAKYTQACQPHFQGKSGQQKQVNQPHQPKNAKSKDYSIAV